MIRVNLLGVERQYAGRVSASGTGRGVAVACSVILVATLLLVGSWHRSLREASSRVDADLAAARQDAARLKPVLDEVRRLEELRARLRERVGLIEQLQDGQMAPVQLLDHVSRSLPGMLWLTLMQQEAGQVTIEGRSTTLTALSDFVGNLGGSDLLQSPVEIVNSQVEQTAGAGAQATPDLIRFTVRAHVRTARKVP